MNKQSKYGLLMDDIKDKICRAEIGVTGVYRLMIEALDEAEQELSDLKASLPKIKADAVLSLLNTDYTCEASNGNNAWSSSAIEEYANKLEAGE